MMLPSAIHGAMHTGYNMPNGAGNATNMPNVAPPNGAGNMHSFYGANMLDLVSEDEKEILKKTLVSLYTDRIFPEEKTVKARLQVYKASGSVLQNFVSYYRSMDLYRVTTNENRVTNITFNDGVWKEPFKGWVDPCSNENPYSQEMWTAFSEYLQNLVAQIKENASNNGGSPPFTFHRGRYGMAEELYGRRLSFFQDLTLGEVCHVVELAIQNKLLAYENNMLLPASACCSLTNALFGRPTATSSHSNESYIKDLDEFKAILAFLLQAYPDGFNLSTLKTKIRTIFGKRLSETVFHQTKLLELVQLSPIDQIVKIVKLQGNCGYLCQPNWATWSEWAKPDFRDSFNFRRPRAGFNKGGYHGNKGFGKGGKGNEFQKQHFRNFGNQQQSFNNFRGANNNSVMMPQQQTQNSYRFSQPQQNLNNYRFPQQNSAQTRPQFQNRFAPQPSNYDNSMRSNGNGFFHGNQNGAASSSGSTFQMIQ